MIRRKVPWLPIREMQCLWLVSGGSVRAPLTQFSWKRNCRHVVLPVHVQVPHTVPLAEAGQPALRQPPRSRGGLGDGLSR